ncbi:hypothetical protein CB1_000811002 [Camelus ferus]|nr:hypothetical protein CB1_000811002 [Camelus ferus]
MAIPGIPYERRLLIMADPRDKALQDYRKKLLEHKEIDGRLKECTGKTLLARAVASQLDCNFLKVVSSSIVDKYIGESARLIREMFNYARDHQPCIIFMDEIDAIDYEAIVKLSDGFNGADLRNVCTEAGMFAIRADHDFVVQEDFMKAVRKVADSKKLESKLDYKPV